MCGWSRSIEWLGLYPGPLLQYRETAQRKTREQLLSFFLVRSSWQPGKENKGRRRPAVREDYQRHHDTLRDLNLGR
jgi:hypothetical protein